MTPTRAIRFFTGRRLDWTLAAIALLLALLPRPALRPWTSDVARVVVVPLAPLTHLGSLARERIRPVRGTFDPRAPEVVELEQELAQSRMLVEQSRLEIERLERSLASLRAVSARIGGEGARLAEAAVVAVDADREDGVVRINAGSRHGVRAGAPVLVDGDVLVGIVGDDVGPFTSSVLPLHRVKGIGVRLYPPQATDPRAPAQSFPGSVLKPIAGGLWEGEVASPLELSEGLVARLADDRYPRVALGARVGTVVAVTPIEKAPLARRVEVAPVVELGERSSVVVVVVDDAAASGATP